jgi:hypothetical protein
MELMHLRNPHFATEPAQEVCAEVAESVAAMPPMKLRTVTLSPREEYGRRPGATETIPDALAAMILSRKTRVEVTLKGVTVREGTLRRRYWHADSPLCNRIGSGETMRVFAVWNRLDPSRIHLLTDDGRYLETLPEEGKAVWFDREEGAKELANHRRTISRVYDHLQRVHDTDSEAAVDRARSNAAAAETVLRTTMNFEAPEAAMQEAAGPVATKRRGTSRMETAEAIAAADRGTTRVQAEAAQRRNEVDAFFDRERPRARETRPVATYDPFDV